MISRRNMSKGLIFSAFSAACIPNLSFLKLQNRTMRGTETKIFDPADGFGPLTDTFILTDASVVKRGNRWWMYLAGRALNRTSIELFSASLPEGAPLTARGWKLTSQGS